MPPSPGHFVPLFSLCSVPRLMNLSTASPLLWSFPPQGLEQHVLPSLLGPLSSQRILHSSFRFQLQQFFRKIFSSAPPPRNPSLGQGFTNVLIELCCFPLECFCPVMIHLSIWLFCQRLTSPFDWKLHENTDTYFCSQVCLPHDTLY